MKLSVNNIVKNKYVLYLVALVALFDILGSIMRLEFSAVLFFYLSGMIAYFYTKNMTLVIGSALLATVLARMVKNMSSVKEGLENEMENEEDMEVDEDELKGAEKQKVIKRMKLQDNEAAKSGDKVDVTAGSKEEAIKKAFKKGGDVKAGAMPDLDKLKDVSKDAEDILKTLEKAGPKSGYQNQQKLTPGLYNMPNKKQLEKQLGEADKMEQAYDSLEQVIGENGIKSMSASTQELVRQQNELLKGLKDVTPALHSAMEAIGTIDLGGLKSMFGNISQKTA